MLRLIGAADLEMLEQLFEVLPDTPFFVKDASLRYVAANRAMAALCGVRRASALFGRRAGDFFPIALSESYEALDRRILSTGLPIGNRLELSVSAGERPVWLLFTRAPVRDVDGRVVGVAASARQLRLDNRSDPIYRRVALVVRRIEAAFDEPLRLSQLARLAGVSESQLGRDVAHVLGVTPHAFLNKTRIDRAALLLKGNHSIATIALECGFADHSAFSRRFRDAVGISPTAYRLLMREG